MKKLVFSLLVSLGILTTLVTGYVFGNYLEDDSSALAQLSECPTPLGCPVPEMCSLSLTPTPAPTATSTPIPPTATPVGGSWQYSSIFRVSPWGWYSGRDTNHDLAAFATPFVFSSNTRITGIRIDLLGSPTPPSTVTLAIYDNQAVDGNNAPYNLLWQGQVDGSVDGVKELSLDITVPAGIYHAVWASTSQLPPGVLGDPQAGDFTSINSNGRNEYFWSYNGTMPSQIQYRSWLYGWGAYYLYLRVE